MKPSSGNRQFTGTVSWLIVRTESSISRRTSSRTLGSNFSSTSSMPRLSASSTAHSYPRMKSTMPGWRLTSGSMNGWKNRCRPGDSRSQSATSTRFAVGGENPGHVRERHRPSRSALERVKRHDLADATRLRRSHIRHFAHPYGSCAAVGASGPSARPRRGRPDDPGTGARLLRCRKYCRSASATSTGTMETNSSSDLTPRAARPDHSDGSAVALGSISITRAASFRVGWSSGATITSGSTHRGSVLATACSAARPSS